MRSMAEIRSVTVIQEERSPRFHMWLFPWYDWMIQEHGGPSLDRIRPIMKHAKEHRGTPQQVQSVLSWVERFRKACGT
jgi:hypothetical protein